SIITNIYYFPFPENKTSVFGKPGFQFLSLLYAAYVFIFLASLFGNSVIIHIIRTDNSMKTTTNYLILNQACVDLLITIAELMHAIHYSSMNSLWFGGVLGLITCKLFHVMIYVLPVFSVWILVTIAAQRFYAVTRPLKSSPVSKHFKKIILSLWAFCLPILPHLFRNKTFLKLKASYICDLTGSLKASMLFNFIAVTLNVILPISIIAVLYTIVCLKLWAREVPGDGTNQNAQQVEAVKTARKATLTMIVIVVLHFLCWFPTFILGISQFISHMQLKGSFLLFIIWLTVAYSGLNPYVYLTFSQNFRNGFKKLFLNFLRKIRILNVISSRTRSFELQQM
ncbi:substance-P receptor-like, partial [Oculina patagonica]